MSIVRSNVLSTDESDSGDGDAAAPEPRPKRSCILVLVSGEVLLAERTSLWWRTRTQVTSLGSYFSAWCDML
jgi:hypothetical protein